MCLHAFAKALSCLFVQGRGSAQRERVSKVAEFTATEESRVQTKTQENGGGRRRSKAEGW